MNNFMIYIWSLLRKNKAAQAQLQGMCLNGGLVFWGASAVLVNYWHILIKGTSGFRSNTLLIRI